MKHNEAHLKKAQTSMVYNDRIFKALANESIRDRVLKGELTEEECDGKNVHDFLMLVARNECILHEKYKPIEYGEWVKVVKRSKRRSTSSVFSVRTYAVYKCALHSQRLTNMLIKFYNLALENMIYLKRWVKILDEVIDKGKGPILGKLRIMQLIEADLKLIMRIFVDLRMENVTKNQRNLSRYNFGSRKVFSIDTATLEKRLMCDYAKYSGQRMVHNLSDLEACYDRQLPRIGRIVEESLSIYRAPLMVFEKVIPVMEHHISTGFRISDEAYGGINNVLSGAGQRNSISFRKK